MKLENLIKELKIRFGENWMDAEIEEKDYPFGEYDGINSKCFEWSIKQYYGDTEIWNENGLIYRNRVWATKKIDELPERFIMACEKNDSFIRPFKNDTWSARTPKGRVLDFEGYQYITEWQYEELTNKPKVGDFGVFKRTDGYFTDKIGILERFTENHPNPYCIHGISYDSFTPIKNKEHIEIIKSYFK